MIIPVGYGQVNFLFGGVGLPTGAQCTLGFDNDASMTAAEAADEFGSAFVDHIVGNLSSSTQFNGTLVKLGPNETGPSAIFNTAASGTDGANQGPPMSCALISKITALGGRKGRGRMFLPGIEDSDIDTGGDIGAGKQSSLNTNFANFLADLTTLQLFPVLLHNDSTVPTTITEFVCQTRMATQRRRQRR